MVKTKMSQKLIATVVAATLLSGCASIATTAEDLGKKVGIENKTTAAAVAGGVIGCGVGGVLGYVSGVGVGQGCVGGAALGALITGISSYQQQATAAKELSKTAKSQGAKLLVDVKTVSTVNRSSGKSVVEKEQHLQQMSLQLPQNLLASRDDSVKNLVGQATSIAVAPPTSGAKVKIYAPAKDQAWVKDLVLTKAGSNKVNVQMFTVPASQSRIDLIPAKV